MNAFDYTTHAVKVIFGKNIVEGIKAELPNGTSNIGLIASQRYVDLVGKLQDLDGVATVFHFQNIIQHVPQSLVDEATAYFKEKKVDILLCLGGGSAIGLGKALVLNKEASLWAVPTTYSGSEMTNIYGISDKGVKTVKRDDRVHPHKVFYDPELSMGMPLSLAVPSAFNAMAHLVEAFYALGSNPVVHHLSLMGMQTLLEGLQELAKEKRMSISINEKLLFGAYLGGKVLCEVNMGLHHKTAHVLGGNFNLEHSKTHTLLLPFVLKYQWDYLGDEIQKGFQHAFGDDLPYRVIRQLQEKLEVGFSLGALGLKKEDLPKAIDFLMGMTYPNPAPMNKENLTLMLESAF